MIYYIIGYIVLMFVFGYFIALFDKTWEKDKVILRTLGQSLFRPVNLVIVIVFLFVLSINKLAKATLEWKKSRDAKRSN